MEYYTKPELKKPADWNDDLSWYEDQWWLMEHPDFVKAMVNMGQWKADSQLIDFSKVPTREVFGKYRHYIERLVQGKPREDYRFANPDLEAWLLLTKKVSEPITEKRRREQLTGAEKARLKLKELEEKLKF